MTGVKYSICSKANDFGKCPILPPANQTLTQQPIIIIQPTLVIHAIPSSSYT